MVGGEIKVVMTLDNGQFTIQTQKAGQTIQELRRQIETTAKSTESLEKHFTGLGQKFHDVVRTASLLRYAMHDINDVFLSLPAATLKTAGEFERMTVLMEGMSKQAGESAKSLDAIANKNYIIKMALESPFDIKTLTDSFVKFKSAGLDPTDGSMKGLVESVAKFGGSSEALHRASIAVQQMAGKGVISMEELRQQLGEAVPNAMATMARGAGVSMAELSAQVKKGTVEASSALKTMFTAMQIDNYGASQKLMDTWDGMLSQLKTRFDLFKMDMANAGFFQTMKDQVQAVTDLLGTSGARAFADDFGQALKSIVLGVRDVIEWFSKWSDEIKTLGMLMVGLFAGNKLASLGAAIRNSGIADRYREGAQGAVDAAREQADKINARAIYNQKLLAEYEAGYQMELQLARKAQADRVAQYDREIADQQAHLQSLAAQRQVDLDDARAYNAQKNALLAQAGGLDLRTDANRARARLLTEEAEAARQASIAASNHATQLAGEINRTVESVAALERRKAALANQTITSTASTKVIEETTQHLRDNIASLNLQAKAVAEVSMGMRTMHGVMEAGKMIWNAFGGWVGIAIGVLTTLGEKLFEYMNRWKEFRDIVEQTKRGIASEEKAQKSKDRLKEIDKEIENKRNELNGMTGDEMMFDPTGMPIGVKTKDSVKEQLNALLAERRDIQDTLTEQLRIIDESASSLRQQQVKRIYDRQIAAVFDAWKTSNDELEKKKLAAVEKAQEGGKKLTPSEQKQIEEPFNKQITEGQKAATRSVIVYLDNEIDRINQDLAKAELTKEKRAELLDALKVLNDGKTGLRRELVKLSIDAENYLGKGLKTNAEEQGDKPIDPLTRYVNSLTANLEQAKLKLKANINEVRGLAEMRQEAIVRVLGDMAEGRFDRNEGKDPVTGKMQRRYVGGEKQRDQYVTQYLKQLTEGKGDVNDFINSLNNLSDAEKNQIRTAVDKAAQLMEVNERQKALNSAQQLAVKAAEDADAALLELANGGLAKVSPGLLALQRQFAALEEKIKSAKGSFDEFNKSKAAAIAGQVTGDARKFAAAQAKTLEEEKTATIKATETVTEAREREHNENLRRIKAEYDLQEKAINDALAMEGQSVEERVKLADELHRVQGARMDATIAENMRANRVARTQMDDLAKGWRDSVQAMNQATANWASNFMDRFTDMMSGGKFGLRDFTRTVAKDLLSITVKKSIGGFVTDMFGSFGKTMSDVLGLGKDKGKTPDDPLYVSDVSKTPDADATKNILGDAKGKLGDMWDRVKQGFDDAWGWIKDSLGTLWDSLSRMFDGVATDLINVFNSMSSSSGAGGLAGAIGGLFGGSDAAVIDDTTGAVDLAMAAANGGVMTDLGPMSLMKYSKGGIANKPQLALFGEGRMPEAYVPLPDGRSIPVTMQGDVGGGNNVAINITINKDGSESNSSAGDDATTWNRVAQRVRAVVMEELVTQQRPGGVLYK